jgi:hypothetical protein
LLSIVENEEPFPFPTISICVEPYQNFTRIKELGLSKDIWTFYKYRKENSFEGWPIKKSSSGTDIWESTTFGLWQMIEEVNMKYVNESYVFNQSNFKLEDENSWLYLKVIKLNQCRLKEQMLPKYENTYLYHIFLPKIQKCKRRNLSCFQA